MSAYFVEKKGWRYDFMLKGERYTQAWFNTKREAKEAEERKRKVLNRPTSTDMDFLTLVNKRLDEDKQRLSFEHYMDTVYHARRWTKGWSGLSCSEISIELITKLRDERSKISNETANKELRYLRSLFNWGLKKGYITDNPAQKVEMLRIEKKEIFIPAIEDIEKILAIASLEQKHYLICLRDTLARSREINNLKWKDINFDSNTIKLYTRKKKHGTKTPRILPMTADLRKMLFERYHNCDKDIDFVFWHRYFSKTVGKQIIGPYKDRKKFMRALCAKAGVKYFRFHPIRHSGASFMANINIPISHIQSILGHENQRTTERYIHSFERDKQIAIDLFEEKRRLITNSNNY